jgi:hypothetical protein
MALNSLYKIVFKNSSNSGFVAGDIVITYWDDVALSIVSYLNGSPLSSGVTLGLAKYRPHRQALVINYTVTNEPIGGPVYQVCIGTSLFSFAFNAVFPYSRYTETVNSASCITNIVCDVLFSGAPVIVKPTTSSSTDGQITVVATSSNGSVRYDLEDHLYAVMTNTTGVFTGLNSGTYIVYARDQYNCVRTISVLLEAYVVYGELYTLEYDDLNGDTAKVSILERDYLGSASEINGSEAPFNLSLRGENSDLFTTILPGNCTIGILSETNFQFLNLFTQDDRKYKIIFYKDTGDGFIERWRGFITPETNYSIEAEGTDQLSNLKDIPFLDSTGNTITGDLQLIKIISIALSYTDLNLSIRSCINIFEIDMDTDVSDDPLLQTYIDVETYIENREALSCYDVLYNILLSFGARLFQWEGYWYLVPVDAFTDDIPYREFDSAGDYITNGSFSPIFNIKQKTEVGRACWANRSQALEVRPAIGKANIDYDLKKVSFGITNGGFEALETELTRAGTGRDPFRLIPIVTRYDNWTLNLNGNIANLPFTYGAFGNNSPYSGGIVSQGNNTTYSTDAYLQSTPNNITFSESDWIRVKFDFYPYGVARIGLPKFIKFKFSFKLENYYLQGDGSWSTDADLEWIEVNVAEGDFNNWKTLEIKTTCPEVSGEVNTTFYFKLMHGGFDLPTWYFTSSGDLQALPTVDLPTGYITWVLFPGVEGQIQRWYRLEASTDATSDPDALRPTDYNGATNKVVWKLIGGQEIDNDGTVAFVRNWDNVTVELLPQGVESPNEIIVEEVNDLRIKERIEYPILNGDTPGEITNSQNTYFNYYKFSDGTPTAYWFRSGVDESITILSLLAHRIVEQHSNPKFKLTGDLDTDSFFGFLNSFYEQNVDKYFIPMGMTINDKMNLYNVELNEVAVLTSSGASGVGEFSQSEFTNDFDI